MIVSASRRTDIPTFYSEWFINRIKEGFLHVRNPMNAHQVSRISLTPDVVDCIVFWTKNPIPMLPRIDELWEYCFYFQFTLTGYGKDVEANLPDKKTKLIPAFQELSDKIGADRVIWRYDPIVVNDRYTKEYHIKAYADIASLLRGYTKRSVISFVDIYEKNKVNMRTLKSQEMTNPEQEKPDEDLLCFAKEFHDIAVSNGMTIATCAEKVDLSSVGIDHNSCIDKGVIESLVGGKIKAKKDPVQRPECKCVESMEVGAYNSCGNGCKYCYANYKPESVATNMAKYDPKSTMLCDSLRPDDKITERKVKSIVDRQMSLFSDV